MRRRDKLKQTGVLKTNGSLMNKIFKVYMLLMFVSCVVLMVVFGIRFSSVYNSQARSHMNDVTVAAETGLEERISQIDQLSVSILINNSVQKNLKEINYQTLVNPENTSFQTEKAAISSEIRGSVFNVPGIVSARIFSLDNVEIVIGTSGKRIKADDITKEKIYDQNGGTLWADDEENGMIGLYRAILSVDDFKPIGYMIIECKNSYFSEKLQSVPSTYKNRFYLLNNDMDIIVSSEKNMYGNSFPLETRDFKNVKIVKDPSTGENSYFTYQYVNNGWLLVSTINVGQLWKNIGIALVSVLITFGIVLLVSLIIMRYAARVMVKPTKKLVDSMTAYQEGNFDSRFKVESQDEISQIGMVYNQMADKVQNLIEKNYTLEIANREAEIEFLKMQINPHFLYNTLDAIAWMCEDGKNEDAEEMVTALARLFRISISKGHELIPIEKEVEHAKSYLKIENYRYKNKFTYSFEVEESCLSYLCNKITLQPIIENAIYHGVKQMIDEGEIWIRIFEDGEDIIFQVEDNGIGMTEEQCREILRKEPGDRTGIGIKNVNDRIKIYFGSNYGLNITSELDEGTCVTIRMPKVREEEYEKK